MYNIEHKYIHISRFILLFPLLFLATEAFAQYRSKVYEEYIDKYSDLAIEHMDKYKIPASVTLAQALLESGAGKSDLARRSNNHFGIKCHRDWRGGRVYAADDLPNDCFRKYDRAEQSYQDHSEFLLRSRYSALFELPITDYKGWARGLQKSGYATDRAYANKLIKLIEDYELFRFDDKKYRKSVTPKQREKEKEREVANATWEHQPFLTHGLVYVLAVKGDTYASIAQEFGFKEKDLLHFNEVPEDFPLNEGDVVYFQKKKSRADKPYFEHVVEVGESMHSISQKYGVRLKNLYKLNKKDYEYVPEEGDVLKLR
ncbi:glucosaminidase domain-containing protein [Limibacterium fermenti]|uniref:glucosaminidase domain-containing protein n=1 Tax=Limibacterium fermenti TaxID=3229863 RepID=UPI000E8BE29D|nr:N-acetylmuramoyl-L-alanine amidase [Porphyromonadaceae bacterium]